MRSAIAYTYDTIAMIDHAIGRILTALDRAGRRDTTVVAFTSDHGELLGDHGLLRKGPPPYRQLLQVPLIVAGPRVASGSTNALTSHVDVKATLLDVMGIEGDSGDGHSFASLLDGGRPRVRVEAFAEYHPRVVPNQYNQTIITSDWRLTLYPREHAWGELFDRKADPGEHHNLFHGHHSAAVREHLSARLAHDWPPARRRAEVGSRCID
jgi:arylsulfatase A-like enzyme